MYFEEISKSGRHAWRGSSRRRRLLLTDLSRTTINQIESGACQDIGVKSS